MFACVVYAPSFPRLSAAHTDANKRKHTLDAEQEDKEEEDDEEQEEEEEVEARRRG